MTLRLYTLNVYVWSNYPSVKRKTVHGSFKKFVHHWKLQERLNVRNVEIFTGNLNSFVSHKTPQIPVPLEIPISGNRSMKSKSVLRDIDSKGVRDDRHVRGLRKRRGQRYGQILSEAFYISVKLKNFNSSKHLDTFGQNVRMSFYMTQRLLSIRFFRDNFVMIVKQ